MAIRSLESKGPGQTGVPIEIDPKYAGPTGANPGETGAVSRCIGVYRPSLGTAGWDVPQATPLDENKGNMGLG